ncbi:MAG: hypothetical protein PHC61_19145 [Chitinivibrionales bacterium]|nr:hypothetical protein [Chitinivibrionales bacterium]
MIYYATDTSLGIKAASSWSLFSPANQLGFSVIVPNNAGTSEFRTMNYWVYYYFTRYMGNWLLANTVNNIPVYMTTSLSVNKNVPMTPALISVSEDNKNVFIIMVNGSWTASYSAGVNIGGFIAASASGICCSSSDTKASPIVSQAAFSSTLAVNTTVYGPNSRVNFTIPPHAAVFIKVSQ